MKPCWNKNECTFEEILATRFGKQINKRSFKHIPKIKQTKDTDFLWWPANSLLAFLPQCIFEGCYFQCINVNVIAVHMQ